MNTPWQGHLAQYRSLARYNHWMNAKVYDTCAELTDDERRRDAGAFFGSIHATLNHILWGDRAWLNRLSKNTYDLPLPIGTQVHADFADLHADRQAMDRDIIAWADGFTPEFLAAPYVWKASVDNMERTHPTWLLVSHVFNHQTHHRGQIATLLTQAGHNVGITDLPFLPGAGDF